jgi:sugar/nucleoside kinase (ribokinase family)
VPQKNPDCLIFGSLTRDTIITSDGKTRIDQPGGNLLTAAAACRLWGVNPGLVSRVGSDYPQTWIEDFAEKGLDFRGIRILKEAQDLRRFIAYKETEHPSYDNPIKHFAKLGMPFPKILLDYKPPLQTLDSKRERSALTLRKEDIPEAYRSAEAAHLCAMDFFSHALLPAALRDADIKQITLEAGRNYMHPSFWDEIPGLVNGLSVFIVRDEYLHTLFSERSEDLWAMAAMLGSFNCAAILIRTAARGYWLYESESGRRTRLPAFPSRRYDITDEGSSFCGGLLASLMQSPDLQRALLVGAAISSLAVEGSGPFYVAEALPGLVEARIKSLEAAIQIM